MRLLGFFLLIFSACQGTPDGAAAPKRPLRDFRGIIHCHSKYSHDSQGTYEEILAAAKAAKIDFICMTDHPPKGDPGLSLREGWTGIHDGVLFIQGAEFGEQILGLGLREPIKGKDRREKIREIHKQGGVAIACHPEEIVDWDEYEEADGMEIYNVHATLKRKAKDRTFMLQVSRVMKEKPEQSFQALQELDPAILKKWDELNVKRPFVGVAGNDAHQNVSFFGYQLDPYPRAFKFVTTHVYAEELTEKAILDGLRQRRAYVCFELSGAPGGFSFMPGCCMTERGLETGLALGGFVQTARLDRAQLTLSYDEPAIREEIRIGIDGSAPPEVPMPKSKGSSDPGKWMQICYSVLPANYRIQLSRKAEERVLPWIVSNPIYVRTPEKSR